MKEVNEIEILRAQVREIREFLRRLKVGAFCSLCGILVIAGGFLLTQDVPGVTLQSKNTAGMSQDRIIITNADIANVKFQKSHILLEKASDSATAELRFFADASNYVGFKAPSTATTTIWTLPGSDGLNGQVLVTNGLGVLSWATPASGSVTSVGTGAGLTGGPITSSGTISIAPGGVTNAMLQNSSVSVNAGTGLTGGGAVSLGGAITLSLLTPVSTAHGGTGLTASGAPGNYLRSSGSAWTSSPIQAGDLPTGNLTVGPNLTVTGGTNAVIGPGVSINLGSNVVTSVTNDTNVTGSIFSNALTLGWTGQLSVARGGTGLGALGSANTILGVNSSGNALEYKSINGTPNRVTVTHSAESITLSAPQDIHMGASPTFAGVTLTGLTPGSVLFAGSGGTISQNNANLFWDNANARLGIGTTSPSQKLSVAGTIESTSGGFKFPDGTVQTSASFSTGIIKIDYKEDTVDQVVSTQGNDVITFSGIVPSAATKAYIVVHLNYLSSSDVIGEIRGGMNLVNGSNVVLNAEEIIFGHSELAAVGIQSRSTATLTVLADPISFSSAGTFTLKVRVRQVFPANPRIEKLNATITIFWLKQ